MSDKRLWFCSVCGFYHHLGAICPKTGQAYEQMKMLIPIAFTCEETKKLQAKLAFEDEETKILELPKVRKKHE